jgi:RNA polymerase sigma-70 factor, ECF subfamily
MSAVTLSDAVSKPSTEDFERIFREHSQLVYRTAYGITGNPEDAEDVVQTLFLRLLRREFPHDLTTSPRAYLYKAAFNLSLNTVKTRKRLVAFTDTDSLEASAETEPGDERAEIHQRLYEAIAELNPTAAQILILRYVHNDNLATIAKTLGTSRSTIAVSLFRSRARLKKLIRASMENIYGTK